MEVEPMQRHWSEQELETYWSFSSDEFTLLGPDPTLTLVANSQNAQFCLGKAYVKSGCLRHSRQFATSVNTRVTSRQLARHALPVHSSRFLLGGQIAVGGARTDLQGLPNPRP